VTLSDFEGEPGLPNAGRTGQGQQAGSCENPRNLGDLSRPSDEAAEPGGQVVVRGLSW
jgi:hypothetical protein